jgi:hypothetical protein
VLEGQFILVLPLTIDSLSTKPNLSFFWSRLLPNNGYGLALSLNGLAVSHMWKRFVTQRAV